MVESTDKPADEPADDSASQTAGFSWSATSTSEKVVLLSAGAATVSMLLPWIDMGIMTRTGLEQSAWIILLIGFTYPVIRIFQRQPINIIIAGMLENMYDDDRSSPDTGRRVPKDWRGGF